MSLFQPRPEQQVRPGEWHDALWAHYMNCVNSLRSQSAESAAVGGAQRFQSRPSWETFEGNVHILEAMCWGYGLIQNYDYTKKFAEGMQEDNDQAKVTFAALTALLKEKNVWKEKRAYLGRI